MCPVKLLLWYTRSSLQFLQEYIVLSLRLFLAHLLRLIRVISCFSVFFRNLSRHSWLPLLQSAPGSAVETRRDGLLRHLDGKYPLDVTNCLYHSYRKPHHHTKHVTSNLLEWSWIVERSQLKWFFELTPSSMTSHEHWALLGPLTTLFTAKIDFIWRIRVALSRRTATLKEIAARRVSSYRHVLSRQNHLQNGFFVSSQKRTATFCQVRLTTLFMLFYREAYLM